MDKKKIFAAKAPTRIDFAGGWTDTPPYSTEKGGSVVNASVTLYMTAKVILNNPEQHKKIIIRSIDYDATVEANSISSLKLDGKADFAKAALRSLPLDGNIEVITSSDIPPGSGLGGSGALGVALTAALSAARGEELKGTSLPEKARDIEVNELKVLGGKQDQYAGMFGGFRYMRFKDPAVEMLPLPLAEATLANLRENSVLVYTGQSRESSAIHKNVVEAYRAGKRETLGALDAIRDAADSMKEALLRNDIDGFAKSLNTNWAAQKALHPSITNDFTEKSFHAANENGALAGKALGAGGGGCLYFYCKAGAASRVIEVLEKTGCSNLPFAFDFRGMILAKS